MSKREIGQPSQEVCPWNMSFATELREEALRPRERFLDARSRDGTRALAREISRMTPAEYAATFNGSAIKRAKLWMLQRNACVVLGNVGTDEDRAVLEAMLADDHEIVREHAAWAVARLETDRTP
jgi:epoxyqueuosine reductase